MHWYEAMLVAKNNVYNLLLYLFTEVDMYFTCFIVHYMFHRYRIHTFRASWYAVLTSSCTCIPFFSLTFLFSACCLGSSGKRYTGMYMYLRDVPSLWLSSVLVPKLHWNLLNFHVIYFVHFGNKNLPTYLDAYVLH